MSLFQRLCPAPFSLVSKAFRGLRPRTRSELQKASLQAASSQEQVSAAEKPEQDPQTVSMETGEGSACSVSSLGCPRAWLPTCYTWACAGGPALEAKNLPELRFAASAPRSVHTPHRLVGQSLCLLHPACFPSAPRGRGVGKQFVIVCWEVPPWPGAESDWWFGVDSGPRGWHCLPGAKHLSTPLGLVCARLGASPCPGRADVSSGF